MVTPLRSPGLEGCSRFPEKRRFLRIKVMELQLVAVHLGNENGGVVLDISETGIGLQAVAQLQPGTLIHLRFDLPVDTSYSTSFIEADAQVIWAQFGAAGLRLVQAPALLKTRFDELLKAPYDGAKNTSEVDEPPLEERRT